MDASMRSTAVAPGAGGTGDEGSPAGAAAALVPALDFRTLFEAAPGIVLVLAPDAPRFTMLAASDERLRATMTTREGTIGRPLFEVFPDTNPANESPTGVGNLRASLDAVLRTRAAHRMAVQRYDLQRPDGTWEERFWEPLNVPVLGPGGEVRYILHRVEDVTARVLRERATDATDAELAATRASESRYRALVAAQRESEAAARARLAELEAIYDSAPVGLCVLDRELRYRRINERLAEINGVPAAAHVGRTPREIVPAIADAVEVILRRVIETGEPMLNVEIVGETPAQPGVKRTWVEQWLPIRDAEGRVTGINIVADEITAARAAAAEREQLLRALELERSRLAEVFAQTPSILALVRGPEHVFELANEAYLQLIGHRDVIGRPLLEAVPELRGQGFDALLKRVLATGEPYEGREVSTPVARTPGAPPEERFFDFVYLPRREPDGAGGTRVTGVIAHGTDVTEQVRTRREVERLLVESERARAEAEAARAEAEAARERTALLQRLTSSLSSATSTEQVADAVVAHATSVVGAVGTVVARVTPDGEQLEIVRAGDMPSDIREEWRRFPLSAPVPLAEAARTGQPVFLESRASWAARYPGMAPLLEASGHHANAVLPLVVDGRVLGVLGTAFDAPRAFGEDDRTLALAVAQQCAQALDRARLFEAERAARDEAEAANRSKGEFLAVMSHELRTPLNAIGGYAELMELGLRGPVTDQQRHDLARIQQSQRHLLGLINQVLNYTRVDAGAVRYDLTDVLVSEALAAAEALVLPQVRAKGLTYVIGAAPPALAVRADREKLQQVLLNLLTNAIKFTESGGEVRLGCARRGDRVAITVSDTGIGVAPEKLASIFEPFVQVDQRLTRPHEGVGLGLAISRDLARGMGGDLAAESTPGESSTFTLTLPLAEADPARHAASPHFDPRP